MQINTTKSITLHPSEGPSSQSVKTRNAAQGVEKREPCYADGENANCQWPLWRSVLCFLKNLKSRAAEHTALPLMGECLRKTKVDRTQAPQRLVLLDLQEPQLGTT